MKLAAFMPEGQEFLSLPLDRRIALPYLSLRRAPHAKRLNQSEVMVLAQGMQAGMAFHNAAPETIRPCGRWAGATRRDPIFAEVHESEECVQDAGFHFVGQVHTAGGRACQHFAVLADEANDLHLARVRSFAIDGFTTHFRALFFDLQRKCNTHRCTDSSACGTSPLHPFILHGVAIDDVPLYQLLASPGRKIHKGHFVCGETVIRTGVR